LINSGFFYSSFGFTTGFASFLTVLLLFLAIDGFLAWGCTTGFLSTLGWRTAVLFGLEDVSLIPVI
jgi:hypothetical protein